MKQLNSFIKIKVFAVTLIVTVCISGLQPLKAQLISTISKQGVIFSIAKGQPSKPHAIIVPKKNGTVNTAGVKINGADKDYFKVVSVLKTSKGSSVILAFAPPADLIGIAHATVKISNTAGKSIATIALTGLATKGLEGENEPPLSRVVEALGYNINVGWLTLANNTKPDLLGDEIDASLFKKAGKGMVEILPVARYSPDFELPFGYYTNNSTGPEKHQVGVLAKKGIYPEHQTLFPALASGSSFFNPGTSTFGLYATGPTHTAFSENVWNMLYYPGNAVHPTRIYPVKDKNGVLIKNTYLVCYEEAKNGDYNDYVFLVKNVAPVMDNLFTTIFDGKSLDGWHSYLKGIGSNKDPNNNFRLEDGALHVIGKDLGYEISDKGFFNFYAKVEFKWGVSKWPPRENAKRDGGFLYNIPMNEPDSIWPKSIECQIQEGDVGDFWMLGFSTITVDGKTNKPTNHIQFVKKRDNEKPYGEWNTVEVISYNGRCVQIVNGMVVNYGDNASIKGGRVILQSEYSEIYYRNVRIRQL